LKPEIENLGGTGRHRRFSFYNLLELAVAHQLVRLGVQHYGIGHVLESLRWLRGTTPGFGWFHETRDQLKDKERAAIDRIGEIRWRDLWRFTARDAADLSDQERRTQSELQALYQEYAPRIDIPGTIQDRDVRRELTADELEFRRRAMQIQRRAVQAEADAFTTFLNPDSRQPLGVVVVFKRLLQQDSGESAIAWEAYFTSDEKDLLELLESAGGSIVINAHSILGRLETVAGDRVATAPKVGAETA
jgi:hypothetical protein